MGVIKGRPKLAAGVDVLVWSTTLSATGKGAQGKGFSFSHTTVVC